MRHFNLKERKMQVKVCEISTNNFISNMCDEYLVYILCGYYCIIVNNVSQCLKTNTN